MTIEPTGSASTSALVPGPLAGLRVVEYGDFVSAPFAAKLLADLGADVIKVEPPVGERARRLGPFKGDVPHPEASAQFVYVNANKRGVTLDLDTSTGQDLLRALLRDADVFIENAPPEAMERRSLGYSALSSINERLLVTSIRPFGLRGPYKGYQGGDLATWHASALGHRYLGEPDREPLRGSGYYASFYSGATAAAGTMLAYLAREATRRGQLVDIGQSDSLALGTLGYGLVAIFYETGEHHSRLGAAQRAGAPAAMLPCKDGYVFIFASEPHMWEGLVKTMGEPQWAQAEMFKGHYRERARYGPEIYALMQEWLDVTGKEEIFEACQANRVPSTAVFDMAEVLHNRHLRERGFFVEAEHPVAGRNDLPGAPYALSASPWSLRRPAPLLGQHNEEVFCGGVGLSAAELAALARARIV